MLPQHVPGAGIVGAADWRITAARIGFMLIVGVELIRLAQNAAIWTFARWAKDPVPMTVPAGLRVAVLTTIVPAKEPIELVERTLRAMTRIRHDGPVDVWILDEGDDPGVKAMAGRLGVRHFSRKGRYGYNPPFGRFRARTKAGNHNAWRAFHEKAYDVVAQMDPDHVPVPEFLERTLGYFRDPDVAFVVAPQVYGNMFDNWVAHGAGAQQYLFSGVVERGGNGLSAPLLIGTNHVYRTAAWRQIGGYQDSIIEDHLTSMRVQGSRNPATGNRWKGVYTPDVIAVGEGPSSWTDYFNQQKRWAYGIWEILLDRGKLDGVRLAFRQRLLYGLVQSYYPGVAATFLLGNLATALYLALGSHTLAVDGRAWLLLWSANMATWALLWVWLRRFNLAAHERREWGLAGMVLALSAGPVYLAAAVAALLRRPLTYAVTAKGSKRSRESLATFRLHLLWAVAAAATLGASFWLDIRQEVALRLWSAVTLAACLLPPLSALGAAAAAPFRRGRAARRGGRVPARGRRGAAPGRRAGRAA
ncbi:glycosyltransferase [Bailinhaonella thermotolerans]|uniref:Glycosyltransferase n=2 Tax=Bailinhaonella thermotolerans TaxID=1070861 RepID=A0A3A4ACM7_9ACTN|nr:glycosyltransferase [Bailinhaonella thermotolerans]